ncbi:hypothetical protein [Pelomonas sp. SE-A7]|uniref:hypothetical protein n=1 Tax=Pelomonas sp. SE-A7 TaxID=3054953 RepID=UPI00259CD31D|nr:hypothetical protein [Pelomonas sp. SE-A7]MDM4766542.1 hypothetical protein [Pelomonas sp. SE-A7]
MPIRALVLLVLLCLAASAPRAQAPNGESPRLLRICIGDSAIPPYLNNDPKHLGRAERLMVEAGRALDLGVVLQRYPFRRCRQMMQAGDSDFILAGVTPENLIEYQFPMKAGVLDPERRMARLNLVWLRRPESRLDWDGKQMVGELPKNRPLLVGTRASQRIASSSAAQLGYDVDDKAITAAAVLRMLAVGRVDVVLGLQEEMEMALADPTTKPLVVMPRPLQRQDFYVVTISKPSASLAPLIERFWNALAKLREQPEFMRD